MNNVPAEKLGTSDFSVFSFNALNSEMGAVCPVVTRNTWGEVVFFPPGTITMTTYNGSICPAGNLYGTGEAVHVYVQPNVTHRLSAKKVSLVVCSTWLPPLPSN
jgi:hypothetical protein